MIGKTNALCGGGKIKSASGSGMAVATTYVNSSGATKTEYALHIDLKTLGFTPSVVIWNRLRNPNTGNNYFMNCAVIDYENKRLDGCYTETTSTQSYYESTALLVGSKLSEDILCLKGHPTTQDTVYWRILGVE